MQRSIPIALLLLALCIGLSSASPHVRAQAKPYRDSGFHAGEAGLSPSARAGREIWYKATVGNDRFHTYVFQQRLGVLIDWFRVLDSSARPDRFAAWGLINDPDCCTPGTQGCPARSLEQTYGFDWCPGDDELLKFVGKPGYRDPACDFEDSPLLPDDPHGPVDQRQSTCDLRFGTSTGALGLRKFPNPRFDEAGWKALNGGRLDTWAGYNRALSADAATTDARTSRLSDGSVEPPFRIGMACGACHIAFNPTRPPQDPAAPAWENIVGLVGNQYARLSEVMVSGMPTSSLEWQVFSHARPGTTDTSAVPNDQVNNPGTMNAIINTAARPTFDGEMVDAWRKAGSCEGESQDRCWCEPGRDAKCWSKSLARESGIHHILKGGGDSIGALGAIQRVYFNIGSCSEQCWVNHLTDLRVLDPTRRNFGQTPFDIGQCRRDCPEFRAMEDRLHDVLAFFLSSEGRAADLVDARAQMRQRAGGSYTRDDLIDELEAEFGIDSVSRGRVVFTEQCARCHSSSKDVAASTDFHAVSSATGVREDWLGNDQSTPVTEVGTFRCRALHSNHMQGHVWEQFASESYRARPAVVNNPERADGGRGYYRNISLLNLWAHAPFMHNNAIGPELCGKPANERNDFYASSYVDAGGDGPPPCWKYDPSVEGRFALYKASMRMLLDPDARTPKITKLNEDIVIDLGPKLWDGENEKRIFGFEVRIPAGTNAGLLGNFQHKDFVVDLVLARTDPQRLRSRLVQAMGEAAGQATAAEMVQVADEIVANPEASLDALRKRPQLVRDYSSCTADVENVGHRFGEDLSDADKNALIAFLATL